MNLVDIITAAVDVVRPRIDAKQLRFELLLDTAIQSPKSEVLNILVWGDAERLQQVMWNLLSNAVKFTPEGGQVTVQLERREQEASLAQITVADTGIGIRADFLPYVFDLFRQADSTSTRSYKGLGLGLAIARYFVEQHDGIIEAESPGEGQGATFIVQLPLIQNRDLRASSSQLTQDQREVDLTGILILVVDDDADVRSWLNTMLQSRGAEVIAVDSVAAAIHTLEHSTPNLLINDIALADADGYVLIGYIKELETRNGIQIPAIALTAYATEEAQEAAIAAGFARYLAKPVATIALITAIASLHTESKGIA